MKKIILSKIYLFLESFAFPFSRALRERKKQRKQITNELVEDYNDLIVEYGLIKEKKSELSHKGRKYVVETIEFLIAEGHITVKS